MVIPIVCQRGIIDDLIELPRTALSIGKLRISGVDDSAGDVAVNNPTPDD